MMQMFTRKGPASPLDLNMHWAKPEYADAFLAVLQMARERQDDGLELRYFDSRYTDGKKNGLLELLFCDRLICQIDGGFIVRLGEKSSDPDAVTDFISRRIDRIEKFNDRIEWHGVHSKAGYLRFTVAGEGNEMFLSNGKGKGMFNLRVLKMSRDEHSERADHLPETFRHVTRLNIDGECVIYDTDEGGGDRILVRMDGLIEFYRSRGNFFLVNVPKGR